MLGYCERYVRVPRHVKQILLRFNRSEPYILTGRGYGIKKKVLLNPSSQPPLNLIHKYHYMSVLIQGGQEDAKMEHLTDVLSDMANLILTSWVTAQINLGHSGMAAVSGFLKYCDIDDETYSQESCYRQWLRIKVKLMS